MAENDPITVTGKVVAVLPGTMFRIELQNGHQVLGNISGKLRKNFVRLNIGDRVKIEMVPYDITKGRIIMRIRDPNEARLPTDEERRKANAQRKR
jgi:translation initiation factor IF-1